MKEKTKEAAALFGSKFFFLIAGYTLYMVLSRLLTTEDFGTYGIVIGVLTLLNMILTVGSMQTVSHFVAAHHGSENDIRRRGFRYQSIFAFPLAILFFVGAPYIANFFHEPKLNWLFRLAACIPFLHAYATINIGYLNGLQQFGKQAILDIAYQILRVVIIIALVYFGFGLQGVIIGYIAAVTGLLLLSFKLVDAGKSKPAAGYNLAAFMRYGMPAMIVAFLFNALIQADLFLIKRLADPLLSGNLTGLYTAAQSIARIPFFIMIAASLIIFPALAKLKDETKENVLQRALQSSRALVLSFAVLSGMAASTIPISHNIILVFYPAKYAQASPALAWLIIGMCLMTLLHVCTSMISGSGRPGISAGFLAGTLGLQIACEIILIPRFGMVGAAGGTTISVFIMLVVCLSWMNSRLGTRVHSTKAAAIAAAALITCSGAIGFRILMPHSGKILTVVFVAAIFTFHCGLVASLGIFGEKLNTMNLFRQFKISSLTELRQRFTSFPYKD